MAESSPGRLAAGGWFAQRIEQTLLFRKTERSNDDKRMGEVRPLTPEDVSNKRFTPVRLREGYDMGEVDQFLDEVEAELARLTKENDDLRAKLSAAQSGAPAPVAAPAPVVEEKKPEQIGRASWRGRVGQYV